MDRSKHLDLENVLSSKPERENLPNAILCLLRRYIGVKSFDHQGMHLNELIHYLLIRLELELGHLVTEVKHKEVRQHGCEDGHYKRNVVYQLIID
jgi:hypothetical protein